MLLILGVDALGWELVKAKLSELGAFADEELPDYITVMVANKKKRSSMVKDLQLFLGNQTELFTDWRTRSRSPITSVKPSSEEPIVADVVNVQTDESIMDRFALNILDEFTEENSHSLSGDGKRDSVLKPTEQRRVVSTSSLGSKSTQKSSEELPAVRSVVKVSTNAPPSQSSNIATATSAAVGGMLLKRAMNEARASTAQVQERPAAVVRGQKRPIEKSETASVSQEKTAVSVNEVDLVEVPTKMTRFVVTMGEEPLLLKPSVKSRLGPRVVAPITNTSNSVEMLDAREILIAKKSQVKSPRMQIILGDSFGEDEEEDGGDGVESDANAIFAFESGDGKSEDPKPGRSNIPRQGFDPEFFGDYSTVSSLIPKVVCRYFPHCKLPAGTCPFYHPPVPVCRFGAACLNRGTTCPFAHPIPAAKPKAGLVPIPSSKLKWVAPGKSATFAASTTSMRKMSPSSSEKIARPTTTATSISAEPTSAEISG
ncbi:unnamed protein product [Hydatigera taeniaeformis]|uniref:Zinc finger CCCH domain-containing protein 14 n=1 Tax=Hydatigena taeniaeformis TaxID=6205 RepID=A0A0R3WZM1_HYDTA|nr:unnamed protein product [Hydatigera taeniaeformis]